MEAMESNNNKKSTVDIESFLKIIDLMTNLKIHYWVEGGWGIDVLIGKQTRKHRDVDIDFDAAFEGLLIKELESLGYRITMDQRPSRVELHHPIHGTIDIHPFIIAEDREMKQANPEGGWFELQTDWFTDSVFEGRTIPCVSVAGQRLFHDGYDLRDIDIADLKNLNDAFPH